jgi:aspartate/tyrosine/aromatic aminotransferase
MSSTFLFDASIYIFLFLSLGDLQFVNLAIQFAYGPEVDVDKVAAIQTLSGTGACRIGGEFYSRFLPKGTKIYIPEPTWGNHIAIYQNCGLDVQRYRYYDYSRNVSTPCTVIMKVVIDARIQYFFLHCE